MILGGLTCAHCAEEIGNAISKMEGVKNSYLNFVNKKLLVELHPNKDEENLIKDIIAKIDSIEPDLQLLWFQESRCSEIPFTELEMPTVWK